MADDDAGKILIDDDWKNEAQAEKAKLAEQEAEREASSGEGGEGRRGLPKADFRGLVGTLATQALMYLGGVADPRTGQAVFDPEYATHMIDLLAVLEEKTKGNLTEEESTEIAGVVRELRARFVELIQMMQQQQAASGGAPPAAGAASGSPASGSGAGGGIITP